MTTFQLFLFPSVATIDCSPSLPRLATEVFLFQHKVSAALPLSEPKEVHVHLEDLLQLQQLFLGELLEEGSGE